MKIHINQKPNFSASDIVFVDCETDEKDNMVGIGCTVDGENFYYLTDMALVPELGKCKLVGHNIKADAHWLKMWGYTITSDMLWDDTMLMSYCLFGSSRPHSLKALAGDLINMHWKTYEEMTTKVVKSIKYQKYETWKDEQGKRHRKKFDPPKPVEVVKTEHVTLDQVPVEEVADYCCNDVKATFLLHKIFSLQIAKVDFNIYQEIEMPTLRVIFDMENRGIDLDVEKLSALDSKVQERIKEILGECETYAPGINIGSSKQLAPVLDAMGFWLPKTPKGNMRTNKASLERHKGAPFIDLLLEHSMYKAAKTKFLNYMVNYPKLPRISCTFNQVREDKDDSDELQGISTGRLSCSKPNLQQIPARSELAHEIRQLFIPDKGKVLVVADFSQIEPRILSHLSKDWYLQDVFNSDKDMYRALIKGTPWENREDGRTVGKTFYLALSYGAQAKKLAKVFNVSVEEAARLMQQCWDNIPQVKEWQMKTIADARQDGYVETMYGRKRFLPELASEDFFIRSSAERKAINTPVQGSAADIMKMTMAALAKAGYPLQLVVHDEIVMSIEKEDIEQVMDDVKHTMENVVKLDVPLKVGIKSGRNWDEAKS